MDGKNNRDLSPAVLGHPKVPRGTGPDAQRVANRLHDFDAQACPEFAALGNLYGDGVTHAELRSVAFIAGGMAGVPLDRQAERDKRVLVKWFAENWDRLFPWLQIIHLRDANSQIISKMAQNPPISRQ